MKVQNFEGPHYLSRDLLTSNVMVIGIKELVGVSSFSFASVYLLGSKRGKR